MTGFFNSMPAISMLRSTMAVHLFRPKDRPFPAHPLVLHAAFRAHRQHAGQTRADAAAHRFFEGELTRHAGPASDAGDGLEHRPRAARVKAVPLVSVHLVLQKIDRNSVVS